MKTKEEIIRSVLKKNHPDSDGHYVATMQDMCEMMEEFKEQEKNELDIIEVNLGKIFGCSGKLYSIIISEDPTIETTLSGGRMIVEIFPMAG